MLEICHKLLDKDRVVHTRNHTLFEPYRSLESTYREDAFIREGDFAERMLRIIEDVGDGFRAKLSPGVRDVRLNNAQVTQLLYRHDVATLRRLVYDYLTHKDGLWILFDNLDKGWPATGLTKDDLILIRCLIDSINKLRRALVKKNIECNGLVFLRNDVFELLVEYTPDRGKLSWVALDWTDPELLREMLRRRLVFSGADGSVGFLQIWQQICTSHLSGEESSQYLIDRCLMRPRSLIELINFCRSHAANLGKDRIDEEDFRKGEEDFSMKLVHDISFEIRDVLPEVEDVLYVFIQSSRRIDHDALVAHLTKHGIDEPERLIQLFLWFGCIGYVRETDEVAYIYDVKYDTKRLKALIRNAPSGNPVYQINPAFWSGLEIKA